MRQCRICGYRNENDAKFCMECGERLGFVPSGKHTVLRRDLGWVSSLGMVFGIPIFHLLFASLEPLIASGALAISIYLLDTSPSNIEAGSKQTIRLVDSASIVAIYLLADYCPGSIGEMLLAIRSGGPFNPWISFLGMSALGGILLFWYYLSMRLAPNSIDNRERVAMISLFVLFSGMGGDVFVDFLLAPALLASYAAFEFWVREFPLQRAVAQTDEKLLRVWQKGFATGPNRWVTLNLAVATIMLGINLRIINASIAGTYQDSTLALSVQIDIPQLVYILLVGCFVFSAFLAVRRIVRRWEYGLAVSVPLLLAILLSVLLPSSQPISALLSASPLALPLASTVFPYVTAVFLLTVFVETFFAAKSSEAEQEPRPMRSLLFQRAGLLSALIGFSVAITISAVVVKQILILLFIFPPLILLLSQWSQWESKKHLDRKLSLSMIPTSPTLLDVVGSGLSGVPVHLLLVMILAKMSVSVGGIALESYLANWYLISIFVGFLSGHLSVNLKQTTRRVILGTVSAGFLCGISSTMLYLIFQNEVFLGDPAIASVLVGDTIVGTLVGAFVAGLVHRLRVKDAR